MKRIILFFIYLSIYSSVAQTITILDADSRFAISNVAVFNEDRSKRVVSDKNGRVDISDFAVNDVLTFTHIAYVEYELLKRVITGKKSFTYKVKQNNYRKYFCQLQKEKN